MFVSDLALVALNGFPDYWYLAQPLIWQEPDCRIVVPPGFVTDLASVPKPLRGILDVNGRSRRPAVLHDFAYHSHNLPRADADDLLRRAIIAEGGRPWQARIYWMGVRIGGAAAYAYSSGLTRLDFVTTEAYEAAMRS